MPNRAQPTAAAATDTPPPRVGDGPGVDLEDLAKRINARERKSRKHQMSHARQQGEDLLRAKAAAGHGNWLEWLKDNITEFGEDQAQRYIRCFNTAWTRYSAEAAQWAEYQRIMGNAPKPPPTVREPQKASDPDGRREEIINSWTGEMLDYLKRARGIGEDELADELLEEAVGVIYLDQIMREDWLTYHGAGFPCLNETLHD